MDVNMDRLNPFMGKMVTEVGAAMNASLILTGRQPRPLQGARRKGPMKPAELAQATGTTERYVREWLSAQAASGYVEYDATSRKFSMLPEQAMVLADEDSPVFLGAVGNVIAATFLDEPKIYGRIQDRQGRRLESSAASACSAAPRVSSAPATSIIWCRNGCPRSTAWSTS